MTEFAIGIATGKVVKAFLVILVGTFSIFVSSAFTNFEVWTINIILTHF
jgi:hypothetical protein